MSGDLEEISPRLYQALEFAFKLHGHDARKQSTLPYLAHLLSVCALVQQDGGDEDEAIAALLHDTLEDKPQQTNRQEILSLFGANVLVIIEIATDTPPDYIGGSKPPWRQRKENYLAHIRNSNPAMLRVTIADKIDNARAILADYRLLGDSLWQRFNAGKDDQFWYYQSAIATFEAAGVRGPLLDELKRVVSLILVEVTK
jgi:(p)ppGpp synthase/HD superfamily hydrolase